MIFVASLSANILCEWCEWTNDAEIFIFYFCLFTTFCLLHSAKEQPCNYSSFQIGHPRSLFHLFLSFQTTTNVQKHFYLVSSGGIQTHDLSVASHKHEVPTRPDVHVLFLVLQWLFWLLFHFQCRLSFFQM